VFLGECLEFAIFEEALGPVIPIHEHITTASPANEAKMSAKILHVDSVTELHAIERHVLVETKHRALQVQILLSGLFVDIRCFGSSIKKSNFKTSHERPTISGCRLGPWPLGQ
jgi:hypothetical protein